MRYLQGLGRGQRLLIFIMIFVGGLLLLVGVTVFLFSASFNANPRVTATALEDGVTVREFAQLPDDDAYTRAVAVAPDGTVYTASYASGVVWSVDPDGTVTELAGTRDAFGSVTGLETTADGTLYVLDWETEDDSIGGATIARIAQDGSITTLAELPDDADIAVPYDITVDPQGFVYVSDRGRLAVWRFNPDGTNPIPWWVPPVETEDNEAPSTPTGLAYDAINDAILITDSEQNIIYRAPREGGATQIVYRYEDNDFPPGFSGITQATDGTLFVAALDQNGIAELRDGEIVYIVGTFRGISDIAIGADGQIYATNFDSTSLVNPLINPQLPFALDVVTFGAVEAEPTDAEAG